LNLPWDFACQGVHVLGPVRLLPFPDFEFEEDAKRGKQLGAFANVRDYFSARLTPSASHKRKLVNCQVESEIMHLTSMFSSIMPAGCKKKTLLEKMSSSAIKHSFWVGH
jgi:hypothetical protein